MPQSRPFIDVTALGQDALSPYEQEAMVRSALNEGHSTRRIWLPTTLAIILGAFCGTRLAERVAVEDVASMDVDLSAIAPAAGPSAWDDERAIVVNRAGDGGFYLDIVVNAQPMTVEVNPRASISRLTVNDIERLGHHLPSTGNVTILDHVVVQDLELRHVALLIEEEPLSFSVLGLDIINSLGFLHETRSQLIIDPFVLPEATTGEVSD